MTREEIKGLLPHREPMLLVDEASVMEDHTAVGRYTVRGDEWFLQGHFPRNPVVPGVVLCEMMGQTCCVLLADKIVGMTPYFTGIDKVKFRNSVLPGDTIEMHCAIKRSLRTFYFTECSAYVNGKLCVSGELSFALVK